MLLEIKNLHATVEGREILRRWRAARSCAAWTSR